MGNYYPNILKREKDKCMVLTGNREILYFLPVILVFNNWVGNYYPNVLKKEKDMCMILTGNGEVLYFIPDISVYNKWMGNYYLNFLKNGDGYVYVTQSLLTKSHN